MTTTEILSLLAFMALTIILVRQLFRRQKKIPISSTKNHESVDDINWDNSVTDDYEIIDVTHHSAKEKKSAVANNSVANYAAATNGSTTTLSSLGFGGVDDMLFTTSARQATANQKHPANYLPRDEDLVVVYVKARPGSVFVGYGLQQALQTAGLHFGEMSIFHRYEQENGQGRILFSVASAVEPGVFDLQRIGGFQTPGLSLFMTLSHCADPKKALIILLDTAQQLADDLGGDLHDNNHQPFNENTAAEYRSRVREIAAG